MDYIQPISILGTALEGPYVLCKELLFSQMNRISILWLQVSMTIKTKHSSELTWYLMANAAAAYNSSIFIPTLSAEQRHYISPKRPNCFYSDPLAPTTDRNTNNSMCYTISSLQIIHSSQAHAKYNEKSLNFSKSTFDLGTLKD